MKRWRYLKRMACIALCLVLLTGCGSDLQSGRKLQQAEPKAEEMGATEANRAEDSEEKQDNIHKKKDRGIYYEKIETELISGSYNPMACYAYQALCYQDYIYTSVEHWSWEKGTKEMKQYQKKYLGEKIGKVYGNHTLYWSTDRTDLSKCTDIGTLYRLQSYNEQCRVGIVCENKTEDGIYYNIIIFECLNDIYLEYGKELFQELLMMDSINTAYDMLEDDRKGKEWTEKEIRDFKKKLYQGKFLETDIDLIDEVQLEEKRVCFSDGLGMIMEFYISKDGKITFHGGGQWFLLQM